jgi:hypothetical protein
MAIAVIGGLVTSTFLSLLVIPVAYTYLDDMKNLILSILKRKSRVTVTAVEASSKEVNL